MIENLISNILKKHLIRDIFVIFCFCCINLLFLSLYPFIKVEAAGTLNNTFIEDGIYSISPKCAQNYSLDVSGGNTADCANVQIFSTNGTNAQRFALKHLDDNYYTMTCVNSGKAVDVSNGHTDSGTNVWQYTCNGTDAQKWILQYSGDENYFYIITKLDSNMCLDVSGGNASDETNVQIYTANFTDAQKWKFTETTPIEDKIYSLSPKCAQNSSLDVSGGNTADCANVQIFSTNGTNAQRFALKHLDDNYYTMTCVNSGKAVDVSNGHTDSGTNVWQYTCNGTDAQKWLLQYSEDENYFYIITKLDSNMCLDVSGGNASDETNVQIYTANFTDAQKWKFTETTPIEDKIYSLSPKCAQNSSLDVSGGNTADCANVQIFSTNGTNAQRFALKYLGSNYYTMTCVNSGKAVDVSNGHTDSGTNVWQYTCNGTDAQKWLLQYSGDENYFYIITKLDSNMCLDVSGGNASDETNVQIYTANFTDAQKWKFVENPFINSSRNESGSTSSSIEGNFDILRSKYPDKSTWNKGYYVGNTWKAGECLGFACQLGYELTGIDPYGRWSKIYNLNSIKAGDIIYCNRPHAIMVTKIDGDVITYVDCNWYSWATVKWDNTIKRSNITSKFGTLKYILSYPH